MPAVIFPPLFQLCLFKRRWTDPPRPTNLAPSLLCLTLYTRQATDTLVDNGTVCVAHQSKSQPTVAPSEVVVMHDLLENWSLQ